MLLCLGIISAPIMGWSDLALAQQTAVTAKAQSNASRIERPAVLYAPALIFPSGVEDGIDTGSVTMKLAIGNDGSVESQELIESSGPAFEAAVLAALPNFVFQPAAKDGQPLSSQINYRFEFFRPNTSPAETAPVEELTEVNAPIYGIVAGELLLAQGEEGLAGIGVELTSPTGTQYESYTDVDGRFSVPGLEPGRYQIRVQVDGLNPIDEQEDVSAGEVTQLKYRLAAMGDGLTVNVRGERPPREVTRRTITRRELRSVPGTGGDALRAVLSLPGVARPPALAGLLIIRGTAPQDNQIFVDESVIPIVYHFGGLSSVIPTELIDKIDFYPGNFSARFGRATGGVIDVGLRKTNSECYSGYGKPNGKQGCFHGMAQLDFIDGRFLVRGPLEPSGKWNFAVGARRSWINLLLEPVLNSLDAGVTTAPVYSDYQVIVDGQLTKTSNLSLRFYGSSDAFEALIKNPSAQNPGFGGNLSLSVQYWRGQANYEEQLSKKVRLKAMASFGEDQQAFSLGQVQLDIKTAPVNLRSEFAIEVDDKLTVNAGMDLYMASYDIFILAPRPPQPGQVSSTPFINQQLLESSEQGTAFRPAIYLEMPYRPIKPLLVIPSIRTDYARDTDQVTVDPRLAARYDLLGGGQDDGHRRTTLKGGIGQFSQPPQFRETNPVFGTPGLRSPQAMHYSLGVEQEFTDHIELSLEGFYKDMNKLVVQTITSDGGIGYANQGSGSVVGLETLLRYKADPRFFGWVAYTLSRSMRQNGPDQPEYHFQYDQTHILTLLGSYRFGGGWEVGARYRLVSGSMYTPVMGPPSLPGLYASDGGSYVPLQGDTNSERLPLFSQLDIRIEKAWQFDDWKLTSYLDIWNSFNNAALESKSYNYDFSRSTFAQGLPIIPSFGMKGEF